MFNTFFVIVDCILFLANNMADIQKKYVIAKYLSEHIDFK